MFKAFRALAVVSFHLLFSIPSLSGQNSVFIGDIDGGNHRSEARAIATSNNGREFLVVGGSESERGWELTTFTTGDADTPPQLFTFPDPEGSIVTGAFKVISDITPDGQFVVGRQENAEGQTAAFVSDPFGNNFSWLTDTGDIYSRSRATGISDDGTIIVGTGRDENGTARAVYWDENRNITYLPLIEGYESWAWAYAVSGNGDVIVGFAWQFDEQFNIVGNVGFVRTEANGLQLLTAPGMGSPEALRISDDGTLAGGLAYQEDQTFLPLYWTLDDLQPTALHVPEGYEGGEVRGFSPDGTMVTGYLVDTDSSEGGGYFTAVLWDRTEPEAVILFKEWAEQYGVNFNGAAPTEVTIHSDGETFYGLVTFPETGAVEGYVVQIDYAATDLTIVGRLPYPDDRTQKSSGDSMLLRDINPGGTLAAGEGNFYESPVKQLSLPVYWTPETGLRELSPLAEGNPDDWWGRLGRGYDVTSDGSVMVGQGYAPETWGYGFVWDRQSDPLRLSVSSIFSPVPDQNVLEESRALGISDDATVIVGQANARGRASPNKPAAWNASGELQLLPDSLESGSPFTAFATDVSGDGSVIVGWFFLSSGEAAQGYVTRAVVWVDRVLMELPMPEGFLFTDTWNISHDGTKVAGSVYNLDESSQPVDRRGILWDVTNGSYELLENFPSSWTLLELKELNWDGSAISGTATSGQETFPIIWDRNRFLYSTHGYLTSVAGLNIGNYSITKAQFNDEGTHLVGQVEGRYGLFGFYVELPEELQPEGAKYLWRNAPPRDDPYRFIEGFGWLYDNGTYPWVWHTEHGWIFTVGSDPSEFLMFDASLDAWWQVSLENYPWMYKSNPPAAWYYYYAPYGSPGERFFYDPSTGQSQLETVIFNTGG